MKKSKKLFIGFVTVSTFSLVAGMFYWVFMRPVFARESCADLAVYGAQKISGSDKYSPSIYNSYYSECLQSKGL